MYSSLTCSSTRTHTTVVRRFAPGSKQWQQSQQQQLARPGAVLCGVTDAGDAADIVVPWSSRRQLATSSSTPLLLLQSEWRRSRRGYADAASTSGDDDAAAAVTQLFFGEVLQCDRVFYILLRYTVGCIALVSCADGASLICVSALYLKNFRSLAYCRVVTSSSNFIVFFFFFFLSFVAGAYVLSRIPTSARSCINQ